MWAFLKYKVKKIFIKTFSPFLNRLQDFEKAIEENRILIGKTLIKDLVSKEKITAISEIEFKIFSQSGEDGIIQYLISKVPINNDTFIEFGVGDYKESNTRFLLINNNWKGLVIDGNEENIDTIKSSDIYWRHDLTALGAFITKENINDLIKNNGITGDIGLLSIDIDGNDYWVWDAINIVSPRIVVCEYNSIFGSKEAISIPYEESFYRTKAHHSNLYFGASLKALCFLAQKKGYLFFGSEHTGSNAFFVRKDVASNITPTSCEAGYVMSRARESRDSDGLLTFISGQDRLKQIGHLKVIDVQTLNEINLCDSIMQPQSASIVK